MRTIIACGSIKPELEHFNIDTDTVKLNFLAQNLHRKPETMPAVIQKAIDRHSPGNDEIVLGYGLCSNGVVGVKAPEQGVYIPKVHDCISFYLGSGKKYTELFSQRPGTYYLTRSWLNNGMDPLGLVENEYTRRVGREMADITMETELKNYTHIAFVNTFDSDNEYYRNRAKKNAEYFNKKYIEYPVKEDFFKKILFGPYEKPDFIYIKPGEIVKQKTLLK